MAHRTLENMLFCLYPWGFELGTLHLRQNTLSVIKETYLQVSIFSRRSFIIHANQSNHSVYAVGAASQ